MKTLAIIGTSNAIHKHGYGVCVKNILKDEVDIISLGSNTSLYGVFTLLQHNITDNYKYVLFDFCLNETHCLVNGYTNKETISSYIAFILQCFQNTASTPLFLLLPNYQYKQHESSTYLWRAFADIFGVTTIDIEHEFKKYPECDLYPPEDKAHFYPDFQNYIANKIIDITKENDNHPIKQIQDIEKIAFTVYGVEKFKGS